MRRRDLRLDLRRHGRALLERDLHDVVLLGCELEPTDLVRAITLDRAAWSFCSAYCPGR